MEKEFQSIVLTDSGDFMIKKESDLHREEKGVEIENPWIINEDENAQRVRANEIFVPYSSVENIQYGSFSHETVE